jgi:hypothetical protein
MRKLPKIKQRLIIPNKHIWKDRYEWYHSRLSDVELLNGAIDIGCDIAVPIGGNRKSGLVSTILFTRNEIRKLLVLMDDVRFPNKQLRLNIEDDGEMEKSITFGVPTDDMKTCKERGRSFGYREEILFDF